MNKVALMGRLVRDPECRYTTDGQTAITRYTLAVDRRRGKDQEQQADFIQCVAFGKGGEFADKYFRQGMRVLILGHIQTGSYTNKDGQKVYTTDVIVEDQEFADAKNAPESRQTNPTAQTTNSPSEGQNAVQGGLWAGFEGISEEDGLPFN